MPEVKYCKCGRPLALAKSVETGRCESCRIKDAPTVPGIGKDAPKAAPASTGSANDVCRHCWRERCQHEWSGGHEGRIYDCPNGMGNSMVGNFDPAGSAAAAHAKVSALAQAVVDAENREHEAIAGVGKDAPTTTNATGGKQSHSPYRADLLPPHALLAVAAVLKHGADKYGANNWHAITVAENLNHAMVHILAHQAGDVSDEHLDHAATRLLFALDQSRSGREAKLQAALAVAIPANFYRPDLDSMTPEQLAKGGNE